MKTITIVSASISLLFSTTGRAQSQQTPLLRALVDCREQTEDARRLACYDEKVTAFARAERAGEVVVADQKQIDRSSRAAFGLSSRALVVGDTTQQAPSQIEAQIRSVRDLGYGKWEFTLSNDMRWRQTDDERIFPKAGQAVTVRTAAMGGYRLKVGSRSIRVIRVK